MPTSILGPYTRTIIAAALVVVTIVFCLTIRIPVHTSIEPLFDWMTASWFGYIGTTWGAAFAVVEAFHLVGLAFIGGTVVASDGRLLGLILTDQPPRAIIDKTYRIFNWALILTLSTGIFMACGVAGKIYFLKVFWYKMLTLCAGMLFEYGIRRPLLEKELEDINPWVLKLTAVASVMVWFTVAALGRWIGYSG
ncbi:MAG: hypothetical protein QGG67_01615 [Gammaproteobacteria bacterium]|jgi:hypothetical protein|nr:hypothetical protein [Gammaproteobacteria bacterium]MBQ15357.1 hypothetical protein [Gammaproteobacteria bacterium]MDP6094683.1 hypothetical protein [Gammaproteobacteria bacterium]|tara:strand:+ start:6701 stop:7282 length:582 start_codon:yes stop_codon:yes gene_type:complete